MASEDSDDERMEQMVQDIVGPRAPEPELNHEEPEAQYEELISAGSNQGNEILDPADRPDPRQPRVDGSTLRPSAEPYIPLHSRSVIGHPLPTVHVINTALYQNTHVMPPLICQICTGQIHPSDPHILEPMYHAYHYNCARRAFPNMVPPCISCPLASQGRFV